jgi:hypothetical protein
MRKPSSLSPWFTVEQLVAWVKEAPDKTAYQRRSAIWLTHAGPFAAHRVADLLAVSTAAVWKRVAECNTLGPTGLDRKGRGGRRWGRMSLDEERAFLAEHLSAAESGDLLTARQSGNISARTIYAIKSSTLWTRSWIPSQQVRALYMKRGKNSAP